MKNLLFRRQFLLSNREITVDKTWNTIKLSKTKKDFYLYTHPDLNCIHYENNLFELIMLGFALNPFQSEKNSSDILKELSLQKDLNNIIEGANILSGRFIIIYNDSQSVKLFHDATGFREVYYINANDLIACGSTPNILLHHFQIPKDSDREINEFYDSIELKNHENIWFGNRTIYKNVLYLLPNHYLDLIENKTVRFWPVKERKILKLNDAAKYMAEILKGTFASAIKQFKIYQGITSGWDTRLLLAASKEYINDIHFYFIRGFKTDAHNKQSVDYLVTKEIGEKNNLPIEMIELNANIIDTEFENIYYQNNILARPILLPVYYYAYQKKLDNTLTVSGTGSNEILRLISNINRNIDDSYAVAKAYGYQKYNYILDSINEWLKDIKYVKSLNYILIDLFNWEQMFGHWGGLSGSEQDIIREELRVFNNRELISTYLSLRDRCRHRDYPLGHVKIIELLSKDLLNFKMDIPKYHLKKFLRILGVERTTDMLYQWLKRL